MNGVVKWPQAIHGMEGAQALSPPENGNLRDFGEPLVPWEQPQTAMLWQRIICVREGGRARGRSRASGQKNTHAAHLSSYLIIIHDD